jgi:hypothetical protein
MTAQTLDSGLARLGFGRELRVEKVSRRPDELLAKMAPGGLADQSWRVAKLTGTPSKRELDAIRNLFKAHELRLSEIVQFLGTSFASTPISLSKRARSSGLPARARARKKMA